MIPVYKAAFQVRWDDVDFQGQLRLSSIASYFQEAAAAHAELLGLGYAAMQLQNRVWVLSRLWIRMHGSAGWGETLQLETWPQAVEKIHTFRGFEVRGEDGRLVAEGSSAWLFLDSTVHRPLRPASALENILMIGRGSHSAVASKLTSKDLPESGVEKLGKRPVLYADLDMNKHVNNAAYVRWAGAANPVGSSTACLIQLRLS